MGIMKCFIGVGIGCVIGEMIVKSIDRQVAQHVWKKMCEKHMTETADEFNARQGVHRVI